MHGSPRIALTAGVSASPLAGPPILTVNFQGHARGGNLAGPYNFSWDFGDGSAPVNATVPATPPQTNDSVSHSFTTVGTFTVVLTVNDSGATATASLVIRVTSQLLLAATAAPGAMTLGETSILTANASGGATPYTFSWSGVPPGCLARANTLTCAPDLPGNFSIVAQVTDSLGATATATVHLLVNPPIGASIRHSAQYICNTGAGTVTINLSAIAQGGTPPYSYFWNLGDGTPSVSGPQVSHPYPLGRNFNATLSVFDTTGANATAVTPLTTTLPACSPSSTVPFFGPPQYLVIGITVAGLVAFLLILWEWRWRPRRKAPAPASPPEAGPPAAPPGPPPGALGGR